MSSSKSFKERWGLTAPQLLGTILFVMVVIVVAAQSAAPREVEISVCYSPCGGEVSHEAK